jgi:hypothetical protein
MGVQVEANAKNSVRIAARAQQNLAGVCTTAYCVGSTTVCITNSCACIGIVRSVERRR